MATSYQPGQVIFDEVYPFVKVMFMRHRKIRCNNCFQRQRFLTPCPSCNIYYYCDYKCRTEDLDKGHALECKSACFRQHCTEGPRTDVKRFLFRMYAMLKMHPDWATKQFDLYDGQKRCFNDLIPAEVNTTDTEYGAAITVCESLVELLNIENQAEEDKVDVKYLLGLYGAHARHSFRLHNKHAKYYIGWAIYIEPSTLTHSCKPNVVLVTSEIKMQARAIAPISEGQHPKISFLCDVREKTQRQTIIKDRYGSDCHCEICDSDLDSEIDMEKLDDMLTKMGKRERNVSPETEWAVVEAEHQEILHMLGKIYHEYDVLITNQYRSALSVAVNLRIPKRELKRLIEATLDHLAITFGKEHPKFIDMKIDLDETYQKRQCFSKCSQS